MFMVFVAFAMPCPWWRTFIFTMAMGHLVIACGHMAEGTWHMLHCEKCPGSMVGWRQEPRSFMEEIILPVVEEIVMGHSWGMEDLRPWDHDELGWSVNCNRWRWW
jgi:hypothetical protein